MPMEDQVGCFFYLIHNFTKKYTIGMYYNDRPNRDVSLALPRLMVEYGAKETRV